MSDSTAPKDKLFFVYGSETGNSESISKRLHQDALALGFDSTWSPLSDFKTLGLDKVETWPSTPIIFVTSSTGDGDPPANAEAFWRQLRRKPNAPPGLPHVRFVILGLGDSNYDSYQGFPTSLYAKLTQMGAKPIIPIGKADEATGSLEDFVEPWVADLWPDLQEFFATGKVVNIDHAPPPFSTQQSNSSSEKSNSSTTTPKVDNTNIEKKSTNGVANNTNGVDNKDVGQVVDLIRNVEIRPDVKTFAVVTPQASSTETISLKKSNTIPLKPDTPTIEVVATLLGAVLIDALKAKTESSPPTPSSNTPEPTPAPKKIVMKASGAAKGPITPKAPLNVSKVVFETGAISKFTEPKFSPTTIPPTKESPFMASIKSARVLSSFDAVKETIEFTVETIGSSLSLVPGDAIGLVPQNCPLQVQRLIEALNIQNPDEVFHLEPKLDGAVVSTLPQHVKAPTTLQNCFLRQVNINGLISKRTLVMLSEYCSLPASKASLLQLSIDRESYKTQIEDTWANILDILERYPDCQPDLGHLLDSLSPLAPRYFSIANFAKPSEVSKLFKFIISVDVTRLANKTFYGVTTNWLKSIYENYFKNGTSGNNEVKIPIFARPHSEFILKDAAFPIIMVGPGTGVAPFMGFLEQRHFEKYSMNVEHGPAYLFSGCRNPKRDWLYHDDLLQFMKEGLLNVWKTAFSRADPTHVEYVQDKIREPETAKALLDLMENHDAIWYICGDARNMAQGVRYVLIEILKVHLKLDDKQAADKILGWAKSKRYLLDIWG